MKCNYKTIKCLNAREREHLKTEVSKWNREFLERESKRLREVISNNLFKLFCLACNEKCGLGAQRIEKILMGVSETIAKCDSDSDVWFKVEESCKRILGKEKYSEYFKDIPFRI